MPDHQILVARVGDEPPRTVTVRADGHGLTTLRNVIEDLVALELEDHTARRSDAAVLRALSDGEIALQVAEGRVGGAPDPGPPAPSRDTAVAVVLDALRRARVLMAFDGVAFTDPDATLDVSGTPTLVVVRLVALRAG